MKKLNKYLQESLRIGINDSPHQYCPQRKEELKEIIIEICKNAKDNSESNPVDLNVIDVSNITDMSYVFCALVGSTWHGGPGGVNSHLESVPHIEYIDVSEWDVSKVENMAWMFGNCNNLKSVGDLSKWDVSKVEQMNYMFADCNNLEFVGDLSNWNFLSIDSISGLFWNCYNLNDIGDITKWKINFKKKTKNRLERVFTNSGMKENDYMVKDALDYIRDWDGTFKK